jgi:Xaa-Pro aminopeptidase
MKYHPISRKMFVENRKRFSASMKAGSLAVFNSNDILPTNADGTLPLIQNSDIFYLSGIDQEESILVMFPTAKNPAHREILFVKETSAHIAIWEGHKYTKPEATETSGIKTIYWLSMFENIFNILMGECEHVYLNTNEHTRAVVAVETREARFIRSCQTKYPLHSYLRSAPILHHLRAIKSDTEIGLMQEACNITGKGFERLLKFVKPGVWEYEIEAELIHEFIRKRSRGFAYPPIIASGPSACVLHYTENNRQCKAGDVILLDVAAEYANYASDLTRCLPVSGKFTKRQRAVYDAVLRVMKGTTAMMKPGTRAEHFSQTVGHLMEEELVKLRLLKMSDIKKQDPAFPAYKKYFMHGVSHYLGLDVHDVGDRSLPFAAGMVLTCEPGIYIPEEGLGIRLENNVLVTSKGPQDLMKHIPIESADIEERMNS